MSAKKMEVNPSNLMAENRILLEQLETRQAELAVISSVQNGLASNLDIDAIFELVGDQIAEIFPGKGIALYTYDPVTHSGEAKYILEKGVRHFPPPIQSGPIGKKAAETKKPLMLSSKAEFEAIGAITIEGTAPSLSGIYTPLVVNDEAVGALNIESSDQEFAFTASDMQLVATIASSLSVALENARLLKETEERNTELGIINSVQSALASNLDIQAIYDVVGDKIHEVFADAQVVDILHYDSVTQLFHPRYVIERGKRYEVGPWKARGFRKHVVETGQTLVINHDMEEMAEKYDNNWVVLGEFAKSWVGVPMIVGDAVKGVISLQHIDNENAFSDSDVRLLQTLANSMSVALENARLFNETQHLLTETQDRAAELATINTIGQALAAETELEALIELTGEQVRKAFATDIVYVALLDPHAQLIQFPYTYGEEMEPLPFGEGLTSHILKAGEPLLINEEMDKHRADLGVHQVGTSARSFLGVPIQIGEQTFGVISVQSTKEEGRFSESDVHLLSTVAANVGTAIRNAQLFNESIRLNEYYEAIIENSPAAIVLLDLEATVTGWNPAAEKLFGYTEAEALGRNVDELVANSEDLHAEAVRYSNKALEERQIHLLARRTRKDGSLVEVEVSGHPVNVDGEHVAFIAIYHDVTELQHARQEAEEANRAKSTFLANMSHELRTPLNAIIGFTRIVRRKGEDVLPSKQVENLDKVLVSADHLLNLINTVLDIAKIEAGRMDVQPTTFELTPLIEQVVDISQPLLRGGIVIETDVPPDLPWLYSDQEKLKQILLNLLGNAAKFTHEGEINLVSRSDGEWLYVDVNDSGIGVSEEALNRIFEDFQQADSSTTRGYGGTGLGLPISRSLARLLGGDLTACSIEGEGSTFTLTIPLRFTETTVEEPALVGEVSG